MCTTKQTKTHVTGITDARMLNHVQNTIFSLTDFWFYAHLSAKNNLSNRSLNIENKDESASKKRTRQIKRNLL